MFDIAINMAMKLMLAFSPFLFFAAPVTSRHPLNGNDSSIDAIMREGKVETPFD